MPYLIPQELKYKEKIVFGLTGEQLGYSLLLLPIFFIFKTHISLEIKITLSVIIATIAILFMFFNCTTFLKTEYNFFKFRKMSLDDEKSRAKMKKYLCLKNIDKYICLENGKRIAAIKVEPINYAIREEMEQRAIIILFQKFLNSIDFPIQILIQTKKIDIDLHLKPIKDKEYKEHILSQTSGVANRIFYIIIKESSNIEIQINIILERLRALNLRAEVVQQDELNQIVTTALNSSDIIYPKNIECFIDYIKTEDVLNRIINAEGYPRIVEAGFLDKIITTDGNIDICIHIEPFAIEKTMILLNKELQKQRADLYSAKIKGILNTSLEIKYEDTKKILEELQKGEEKLFDISFYINCKAKTIEELNLLTKKIEAELNSLMIIPRVQSFRQTQALKSLCPFSENTLNEKRNITTKALSAFFPFSSQFLKVEENGVWFGNNKHKIPIIKDIFNLTNPNGLILATSGSGKSYFSKLLISRQFMAGTKVIIVDPQSEYTKLTEKFKGEIVNISRTSETIINPLDLMGHDYAEKRLALMDLMPIMLGEMSEIQKSLMDRAITLTYQNNGITQDRKTWGKKPPILKDLLTALESMCRKSSGIERPTYNSLMNRLSLYVDGVFSFLNKQTKINFQNRFVCFNIGEMPKQVKPVIMFLILDYVYMKMKQDKERKILVIDEAWSMLERTEDASYVFEIVKTSRKFNLGLLLITQDVADLIVSKAGNAVLANSAYTLLMRQKPAVIDNIVRTFHLSEKEKETLLTASIGEGILMMENEHSEIKIIASEKEHKIITTKPDEIKEEPIPQYEDEIKINLDEDKGYFKAKGLSKEQVEFLLAKGYKKSQHVSIGKDSPEEFFLKPKGKESEEHFFMVMDVAEFLSEFTQPKISHSKVADVIFTANGKKFAIEIETGKVYAMNKKKLKEKVKELNKVYGKNWFFVMTTTRYIYRYRKFGQVFTRKRVAKKLRSLFKKL
ncbi:MAG: ATP-binding protein [Nanoarchaeota archaeon]|nr:ATP-binding protein [Nanoarchaeota archaeon]